MDNWQFATGYGARGAMNQFNWHMSEARFEISHIEDTLHFFLRLYRGSEENMVHCWHSRRCRWKAVASTIFGIAGANGGGKAGQGWGAIGWGDDQHKVENNDTRLKIVENKPNFFANLNMQRPATHWIGSHMFCPKQPTWPTKLPSGWGVIWSKKKNWT